MADKKTRTIGSGITKREKALPLEAKPENRQEIIDSFDRFHENMRRPWAGQKPLIDEARRRLSEIEAEAPSIMEDLDGFNDHFKPHESPGWYFQQIDACATIAEGAVAQGRPWEAVFRALQIGHHLAELEFKELWEFQALKGQKLIDRQALANEARRTNSAEHRYQVVLSYREKGLSWERSYHFAARDLGDSASTIKKDCLKQRKLDQSVD